MTIMAKLGVLLAPFIMWSRPALFLLLVFVSYLALGGVLFPLVENSAPKDLEPNTTANLVRRMVSVLRKDFNDSEIRYSFDRQSALHKRAAKSWSNKFGEYFLFSFVLITTIGYGNVVPRSWLGKAAVMVYCFVGLPLTVTFLRLLSLKLRSCLRALLKRCMHAPQLMPLLLLFVGAVLVFLPADALRHVEGWTYVQCVYYACTSFATIGFGDFVAGYSTWYYSSPYYWPYLLVLFVWLLVGLAFTFTATNLLAFVLGLRVVNCRCWRQRATAAKEVAEIYKCAAELTWQLTKYTPQKFSDSYKIEAFREKCIERPHQLKTADLVEMFAVADDLRGKIYDEMDPIYVPPSRLRKGTVQPCASHPTLSNFLHDVEEVPSAVLKYSSSVVPNISSLAVPKDSSSAVPKDPSSAVPKEPSTTPKVTHDILRLSRGHLVTREVLDLAQNEETK